MTLVSKRGSIQINEHNLFDSTSLHCSTGHGSRGMKILSIIYIKLFLFPLVCPKCCSANGRCENGSCVCNYGYRNGSSDCGMNIDGDIHGHLFKFHIFQACRRKPL